jgi:hypothetical protein
MDTWIMEQEGAWLHGPESEGWHVFNRACSVAQAKAVFCLHERGVSCRGWGGEGLVAPALVRGLSGKDTDRPTARRNIALAHRLTPCLGTPT